ncbi:MAG TPA: glutamate-1-semialdehyde 2,1-aminomutase [Candidatus Dormibacteraeota bacterium]|nr:glutamate-1-semialdehyde 2,1-aminomutase [Candidatus Dormibacteraeota bacterium]
MAQPSPRRTHTRSREIFARAEKLLVGGVNSPVRAFQSVGGEPLIIERAEGAHLFDADGNELIDFLCSWGAMIAGHAHPAITSAIADQARRGTSFGITNELEVELASAIIAALPSVEKLRFVSSGTEAAMSAVRLARAFTKRDLIMKFEGCYHGHADGFLSQAGSGLATLGIASSHGVPRSFAELMLSVPYNDLAAVEKSFEQHRDQIAAVIVEPVAANMGVVAPVPGFLAGLRDLTRRNGALLIFDEVITGFRLAYGGAQTIFNVAPDLTTLGKVIGGGLPVGAYGGRADIMNLIAPLGPVYQAGTLSGNPLAMRAGIETLKLLRAPGFYATLAQKAAKLGSGLRNALTETGVSGQVSSSGSLATLFFTPHPVTNYTVAKTSDREKYAAFFKEMLSRGFFLAPSQFEAAFISSAHTDDDISSAIAAARSSLRVLAR